MRFSLILAVLMMVTHLNAQQGQRRHGHPAAKVRKAHPHAKTVRVVRRSAYRPAKVVVYRPAWGPNCTFNHRWVYFPYRNYYWDNWRNHYVYYNGIVWVSQTMPPPDVNIATMEQDKRYELPEENDDLDSIYVDNSAHKVLAKE